MHPRRVLRFAVLLGCAGMLLSGERTPDLVRACPTCGRVSFNQPRAVLAGQIHVRVATDLTDLDGLLETSNDWHGLSLTNVVCCPAD